MDIHWSPSSSEDRDEILLTSKEKMADILVPYMDIEEWIKNLEKKEEATE